MDYDQEPGLFTTFRTHTVRIYSTLDGTARIVDWPNQFTGLHRVLGHTLHWLADGRLLYSKGDNQNEYWFAIDPATGEVTPWDKPVQPDLDRRQLAPDGAKAVYNMPGTPPTLHNGMEEIPLRLSSVGALWRSDSSAFLAITRPEREDDPPKQLVLFDLDGQVIDVILTVPDDAVNPAPISVRQLVAGWALRIRRSRATAHRGYPTPGGDRSLPGRILDRRLVS